MKRDREFEGEGGVYWMEEGERKEREKKRTALWIIMYHGKNCICWSWEHGS